MTGQGEIPPVAAAAWPELTPEEWAALTPDQRETMIALAEGIQKLRASAQGVQARLDAFYAQRREN